MLKIHSHTDTGLHRRNNEDYHFTDAANGLMIVADGAGGHDHGEIASRLAVESCYQYLTREDYLQDTSDIPKTLIDSISFANQQVIDYKKKHMPGSNMGTTLSVVHVGADMTSYAWMGDSRIYLFDLLAGQFRQLSTDHTLYQEMLDRGEVGQHYNKHILSRMLGTNPYTRPDGDSTAVSAGQVILVCTDGLSGLVSEEKILGILIDAGDDLDAGLLKLVAQAKDEYGCT